MTKVSVIIPVYNTENYLKECLDSVVNQTLKDIEIICINDGSTDNSPDILREYESKDSRIKIITQENHGLSYSRNIGIKNAEGDYIYFIDSDDILELNALEELYEISNDKNLDMVLFKLINYNDETKSLYTSEYYEMEFLKQIVEDRIFNYDDITTRVVDIAATQQCKFYNRNLISDMKFPEGLIFEDNPFFIESFFKSEKVFFYDKHLCKRRIRNESITTSNNLRFSDTLPISNMIIDIAKKYNHYDELKDVILNKKINSAFYRFSIVEEIYKEEFFERLKKDFALNKENVENSNITGQNKYIFYNALEINNFKEYELKIKYYIRGIYKKTRANEFMRMDMKNIGNENNSITILENSDRYLQIYDASWLTDNTGEGFYIESNKGELDLKLKMVNGGTLNLWFKSVSIRDDDNNRIKVLVDYTSLTINGETYLKDHNLYSLEKPFTFKKDVKNSEIIDIHLEWMTYDKMSSYVEEIKIKEKKYNDLLNEKSKYSKLKDKSKKSFRKISNVTKRN